MMHHRNFRWKLRLYPPLLGAGIRISHLSADFKELSATMPIRWYNRNVFGTHFGGSLYTLCDPFYVLMLMQILPKDYTIWDKNANIHFVKPGRSKVTAHFRVSDADIQEIVEKTRDGASYLPVFNVNIVDENNHTVAVVDKTLYVRKKQSATALDNAQTVYKTDLTKTA